MYEIWYTDLCIHTILKTLEILYLSFIDHLMITYCYFVINVDLLKKFVLILLLKYIYFWSRFYIVFVLTIVRTKSGPVHSVYIFCYKFFNNFLYSL